MSVCCESKTIDPIPYGKPGCTPMYASIKRSSGFHPPNFCIAGPEVRITESEFEKICIVGKGGFSHVYQARHLETGIICAMKIISKQHIIETGTLRGIKGKSLNNPN